MKRRARLWTSTAAVTKSLTGGAKFSSSEAKPSDFGKTPFTKRTSRRPPLTAHPNSPRRPAVQRTKTTRSGTRETPVFGALSWPRPQATAGDRRRQQATAGDRRRASASAAKTEQARLHGTKTPPRLIPATWGFAHQRVAEMGGGEWRPSQGGSAQRRANDRGNGDFPLHATGSHGPDAIQ